MAKSRKGGAGITEALWAGTAVFAATKAKSYSGFITSTLIYGVVLLVVLAAGTWLLKTLGLSMPKETFVEGMPCPDGSPSRMENGQKVCGPTPAGNTTVLPS
jgi:hypothetical protein